MKNKKKVMVVVGARPQFIKAAVISTYLKKLKNSPFEEIIVHTGQHYDDLLSDVFFQELKIHAPKYNLGVGSHTTADQIALMLKNLDSILKKENPNAVLIFGDTNSTLAASLCSAFRNIPIVHVEAGERVYRRNNVPEEINRVLTDHASYLCLTCTNLARDYLLREGMCPERVKFVGDPMYDLFKWTTKKSYKGKITYKFLGLKNGNYHLATIHRAENTTNKEHTISLLSALDNSSKTVILPIHPRLEKLLKLWKWKPKNNLKIIKSLSYFELINILLHCDKCITDSGGLTKESFFAEKACITPMKNSWWTDLVEAGCVLETGSNFKKLADAIENFKLPKNKPKGLFGDGNSAKKIVDEIAFMIKENKQEGKWHHHGSFYDLQREKPRRGTFTYINYKNMINKLKNNNYTFASFKDAKKLLQKNKPFVLMRHDVDMSLKDALEIAKIEAKLDIKSTYFFLLRTIHYNIFSEEDSSIVSKILNFGHDLGLHLDVGSYPSLSAGDMAIACNKEAEILENWFGKKVSIISFHRPDKKVLQGSPELSKPKDHTYMSLYNKKIKYFSDSKGKWKFGNPLDSREFKQKKPLHILTHPIWWNKHSLSAYETLLKLVQKKNDELEKSIAKNCEVYNVGFLKKLQYLN